MRIRQMDNRGLSETSKVIIMLPQCYPERDIVNKGRGFFKTDKIITHCESWAYRKARPRGFEPLTF